jgi:hypothetical protein
VVVFVIYELGIPAREPECHAPVATDFDCPCAGPIASQSVEVESGQSHVSRLRGDIQPAQDLAEPVRVFGLDTGSRTSLEKTAQTLVPETLDRHCTSVTLCVTGVNHSLGRRVLVASRSRFDSNQLTTCEADAGSSTILPRQLGPRSLHLIR